MSLFDDFRCAMPLPDGKSPIFFQTKDLACYMHSYEITKDGTLMKDGKPDNYSGAINFYGDDHGYWRSYIAWVVRGRVKEIIVAPDDGT